MRVTQFFLGRRQNLSGIAAVVAALTFNNWLAAPFLNRRLLQAGGSISELSVHSQPYAHFFQALDILSGLAFVVFSLLITDLMSNKFYSRQILVYGTALFGLANIVDALL